MKFLVDNQLPLQLAVFLRGRGHDCEHVLELGFAGSTDSELWQYARGSARAIVSKDEDFVYLVSHENKGQLVWVRLGNCRNAALIAAFDQSLDLLVEVLQSGQRIVELR